MYSTIVSIVSLFIACHLAIAAPVPDTTNQVDNAYSGVGGHAIGGSVTHNTISGTRLLGGSLGLLKLFSDNAGSGGRANSAPTVATIPSNLRVGTSSSNTDSSTSNIVGNSFSGAGGITDGGSVNGAGDALISLFSGNGGNGGGANSGTAGRLLQGKRPTSSTRVSRLIHSKLD